MALRRCRRHRRAVRSLRHEPVACSSTTLVSVFVSVRPRPIRRRSPAVTGSSSHRLRTVPDRSERWSALLESVLVSAPAAFRVTRTPRKGVSDYGSEGCPTMLTRQPSMVSSYICARVGHGKGHPGAGFLGSRLPQNDQDETVSRISSITTRPSSVTLTPSELLNDCPSSVEIRPRLRRGRRVSLV